MRKSIMLVIVILAIAGCGRRNIYAPTPTSAVFQPTQTPFVSVADQQSAQQANLADDGEVLFNTFYAEVGFACETCHFIDQETRKIGPGLVDIVERGATRVDGQSAETYIRNSILHPNDYVVDQYTPDLMPQTYADLFAEDELDALVAYLMSLAS